MLILTKKSLKIPKEKSEAVNRRRKEQLLNGKNKKDKQRFVR
jgi:hypothetical protein